LDRRLLPARPDLAAAHLQGQVKADRFVEPVDWQVTAAITAIRRQPCADGPQETQLLFGEVFAVLDTREGWAWGFSRLDGYVGWVNMAALSAPALKATHRVSALRTYLFSKPDLKSVPHALLSMNAKICVGESVGRFVKAGPLGFVFEGHLAPIDDVKPDFVSIAEQFVGAPYQWGGKESAGLDCSGLVQTALEPAGISVLRDTDMQEVELAKRFSAISTDAPRQRGDIVFWAGHVGIMVDGDRIIHANAYFMETVIEPVAETIRRAVKNDSPVTSVIRMSG